MAGWGGLVVFYSDLAAKIYLKLNRKESLFEMFVVLRNKETES